MPKLTRFGIGSTNNSIYSYIWESAPFLWREQAPFRSWSDYIVGKYIFKLNNLLCTFFLLHCTNILHWSLIQQKREEQQIIASWTFFCLFGEVQFLKEKKDQLPNSQIGVWIESTFNLNDFLMNDKVTNLYINLMTFILQAFENIFFIRKFSN